MKKANPDAITQNLITDGSENAEIIPIRTETVLSQYPLHRLSKGKEPLAICLQKTNGRGVITTTWEVLPSQKYGEPGILAYKIDTLIINRLIDEMRPNIPEIIKLGSLNDIGKQLGREGTRNTKQIADALKQNALAGIEATLEYTTNEGTKRTVKFTSTRYGVVFIGEELPNGTKADAVYIVLNRTFHDVLRQAKTRPLDYVYLQSLPPASQRLYELISYQIFAAIKFENPRAKYLYSDLCKFAPITRHEAREQVRKQLFKIHAPHIKASYLKKVELEATIESESKPDWIIWYTPGRKAKQEYREFTTKRIAKQEANIPRLIKPVEKTDASPKTQIAPEHESLISKLVSFGVEESRAALLVSYDAAECKLWADAWSFQNQKGMENPAAVLISFIEKKRRPLPAGYKSSKNQEARQQEQQLESERVLAKDFYFDYFSLQYRELQRVELAAIKQTHNEAFVQFEKWLEKNHGRGLRMVESEATREKITLQRAAEFFTSVHPELGIKMSTFEEWDNHHNAERANPLDWYRNNSHLIEELLRR